MESSSYNDGSLILVASNPLVENPSKPNSSLKQVSEIRHPRGSKNTK